MAVFVCILAFHRWTLLGSKLMAGRMDSSGEMKQPELI